LQMPPERGFVNVPVDVGVTATETVKLPPISTKKPPLMPVQVRSLLAIAQLMWLPFVTFTKLPGVGVPYAAPLLGRLSVRATWLLATSAPALPVLVMVQVQVNGVLTTAPPPTSFVLVTWRSGSSATVIVMLSLQSLSDSLLSAITAPGSTRQMPPER